jgi:hypothetical protein
MKQQSGMCTVRVSRAVRPTSLLRPASRPCVRVTRRVIAGERRMDDEAEFADHIEMQEFVERNGLDYAWAGTALFEKRSCRPIRGSDQAGHHDSRAVLGGHY